MRSPTSPAGPSAFPLRPPAWRSACSPSAAFRRPQASSRKYLIFAHAIQNGNLALALVGIFASLIGVVFYLRVIYMLYMRDEISSPGSLKLDFGGQMAAVLAAAGTIALGAFPGPFLAWLEVEPSPLSEPRVHSPPAACHSSAPPGSDSRAR